MVDQCKECHEIFDSLDGFNYCGVCRFVVFMNDKTNSLLKEDLERAWKIKKGIDSFG